METGPDSPVSIFFNMLRLTQLVSTYQGEGPYTGTPVMLVRMAGCNLYPRCSYCDEMSKDRAEFDVSAYEIMRKVLGEGLRDILLTGGEPLWGLSSETVDEFKWWQNSYPFRFHIETNGTLPLGRVADLDPIVVCSPKRGHPFLLERATALKFIYPTDWQGASDLAKTLSDIHAHLRFEKPSVWLQPEWGTDVDVTVAAARELQKMIGSPVCLSVQTHRYVGLP